MNDGLNLFGSIVNGKLEIRNRESLDVWIKNLSEGSDIVIKLRNQKDFYSNRQLRLLYGEFRSISEHTGYSVEDVKTMMKMHCGYCYTHEIEGKEITICKSVSEFNKKELSSFIEQIDIYAGQKLGLKLLSNEDIHFLNDAKII